MTDNRLSTIVKAAEDKKAFDIKVIEIKGISTIADYFVIVSGNSKPQVSSIGEEIEHQMSENGEQPLGKDGYKNGDWVLLDYGNIIVHIFQKDVREFYDLERLWKDAKNIDVEEISK